MGQALYRPPSVEGWHEGKEWIESGALMERVNFVAKLFRDPSKQGVRDIIDRIASSNGGMYSPEETVDLCLDLIGPVRASEETRSFLIEFASAGGGVDLSGDDKSESEARVGEILALIAATPEYQFS